VIGNFLAVRLREQVVAAERRDPGAARSSPVRRSTIGIGLSASAQRVPHSPCGAWFKNPKRPDGRRGAILRRSGGTPMLRTHAVLAVALVACAIPAAAVAAGAGAQLKVILDEAWEAALRDEPLLATHVGDKRYDDRLPSYAPVDFERRAGEDRRLLERLSAVDRAGLSPAERVSYDMFKRVVKDDLAELEFRTWRMPLTAEGSFHSSFARLPDSMPLQDTRDYENYLARLRAFPAWARQQTENMREGIRTGFVQPRVILEGFEDTITTHIVDETAKSVFWKPFLSFPTGVPEAEHERLRASARAAIETQVVPAYRAFLEFMREEYLPNARAGIGASDLPAGRAYYEYLVKHFTTLDVTPDEVHALGLEEVARIKAEMMVVLEQVGWEKSFAEFLEFLRSDPRFYPKTAEELLERASFIAKRMDGKLPALFKTLPRQPYGVEPVPAYIAPKYTAGRYNGAPIGGTRAGMYWVNTHALDTRTLYTLEALTLHEAVPGHHLQTALQQELADLPAFRRHDYVNAFGEGWGLYSERLGLEAGFYQDPYSNFGRLTYEMWRACRLVVDTGMHWKGWSRDQALEYLAGNTALSLHEVTTETDRYIGWPGQALAYKMGELKIRELRKRAETALGTRFDLRLFHDAVLRNGSVPLSVLEEQIDAFIAGQKASPR
jgi:uncharacterized protein (DUF885 family)